MIRRFLYKAFSILGGREVAALEKASFNPREAQQEKLLELIHRARESAFGQDHGFDQVSSIQQFQKLVPIRDYEGLRPYVQRAAAGESRVLTGEDPFAFAITSGTTGSAKLLPLTEGYIKEFRRASVVSGYQLLRTFPGIAKGVTFSVVSSAEEGRTEGGTVYGAISGHLFLREPALIKKYISPIPYEVFLIDDYETRYYTLLRLALVLPLTCVYTLNPSTIMLLCKKLQQHGEQLVEDIASGQINPPGPLPASARVASERFQVPDRQRASQLQKLLSSGQFLPYKIWPSLQVVSCWTKAAAAFYLDDLKGYFGSVPICDITYGASEGRGTVFMGPEEHMLALRSHFFEFVPESQIDSASPNCLLADELEVGSNYYILFTTAAGLYRYNINDVVKVVGFHNRAPLLEFQYKGGNVSSFTGEKITELQVVQSMSLALQSLQLKAAFFTLIPEFKPEPHYVIWIEPSDRSQRLPELLKPAFDEHLCASNPEYKTKRQSQRLSAPEMKFLEPGTYEALRKELSQSGVPDSQIKVSHLNPKKAIRDFLEQKLHPGAII